MAAAKTIKVQQTGSPQRRHHSQRETLIGLGLNKIGRVKELPDNPATRGMIGKVQHLVRVVLRLNLTENLFDLSFFVNQKGHAVVAHVRAAHEFFLAVCPVTLRKLSIGVGQQAKWQTVFRNEFLMRLFAVQRYAEHFDAAALELRE